MAFSNKSRLEEIEVRKGELVVLQEFVKDATAYDPQNPLLNALDHHLTQSPNELRSRDIAEKQFQAKWRSDYEPPVGLWEQGRLTGGLAFVFREPDSPDLRTVNDTLEKEWRLFEQSLDEEWQVKAAKQQKSLKRRIKIFKRDDATETIKSPTWRIDSKAGQPFGIQDIITTVRDAETIWKSGPRFAQGRGQKVFHSLCRNLDNHSNMMKCLPDQNHYLSVFCGVTTTLIKASVNHQNVAEGLDKSLSEIIGPLEVCESVVSLMGTDDLHEDISDLYRHVFCFLSSAIKWYQSRSRRKILDALTENFADSLQEQVTKIKEKCRFVYQRGAVKTQKELRDMRLAQEVEAANAAAAREEAREAIREQKISNKKWEALAQRLMPLLGSNTQAWLHNTEEETPEHHSTGTISSE
ncbi:MAG: hypothetical protein Q9209_000362 [Squamulea sp. 1 TL-2023]